jgi:hypothetical protein
MCSSSGMSRLRLREGRAGKSRLRGQSDKAFMTLNRAGIALVPRETGVTRIYCPSVQREERMCLQWKRNPAYRPINWPRFD